MASSSNERSIKTWIDPVDKFVLQKKKTFQKLFFFTIDTLRQPQTQENYQETLIGVSSHDFKTFCSHKKVTRGLLLGNTPKFP